MYRLVVLGNVYIEQIMFNSIDDDSGNVFTLSFLKNSISVSFDCTRANKQFFCNFLVCEFLANQSYDFDLPWREFQLYFFLCRK